MEQEPKNPASGAMLTRTTGVGVAGGPDSMLSRASGGASEPALPLWRRPVLFPQLYAWFVFLASVDLMFTWVILYRGGRELNALANWIIQNHNLPGVVVYKFALVILVVGVCETVGRRSHAIGCKLARWAVALTAVPVVIGGVHLLRILMGAAGVHD
jgi:hypothetical protein